MLASQYASTQSTSQTTISMQLDKDRYYAGVLTGPGTGTDGTDDVERPRHHSHIFGVQDRKLTGTTSA